MPDSTTSEPGRLASRTEPHIGYCLESRATTAIGIPTVTTLEEITYALVVSLLGPELLSAIDTHPPNFVAGGIGVTTVLGQVADKHEHGDDDHDDD